jgi:hypothetical protein
VHEADHSSPFNAEVNGGAIPPPNQQLTAPQTLMIDEEQVSKTLVFVFDVTDCQ